MDRRYKVFPVQLISAHSNNPNSFRLNENALNAVLGHREIANKKVAKFFIIIIYQFSSYYFI